MKLPTSIAIEHDLRDALDRMAAAELRSWLAEKPALSIHGSRAWRWSIW
jgi:hypothetical protein